MAINRFALEFKNTEIFRDLGNYSEMSQLSLSKKLPKWRQIYNNIMNYEKHFKKYCSDCDQDVIFRKDYKIKDCFDGRMRAFTRTNVGIIAEYSHLFVQLYKDAKCFYLATKERHELESKEKMDRHHNEKIECECGGKYSNGNKSVHLKTKKHLKFCLILQVSNVVCVSLGECKI